MTKEEILAKAEEIAKRKSRNYTLAAFKTETCELAPSYGWDEFEYHFIDVIIRFLEPHYYVRRSRSHGVNDFEFTIKL